MMSDRREGGFGGGDPWSAESGGVRTGGGTSGIPGAPGESGFFFAGREDEPRPDMIGPYRILEELGEGGFGIVYLAQQAAPVQRRVALKVVKPGMDSREVLARFAMERQALALMTHPCIARIFDAGVTDKGRPYFAMEYVKGTPITSYCDANQLPVRRRLELFAQVCDGVHHAHQKGIIHRDLKPANILVSDEDGQPRARIIDFGVAKALSQPLTGESVHTRRQQLIGTLEYMSPEQAGDAADDVDVRADVYALGVVLYQLLTGALPYDRGEWRTASLAEIQEMIRDREPPSPSRRLTTLGAHAEAVARHRSTRLDALERELRRDLQQIPQMAMRKDRTRRYQSAAALADDVRAYLAGKPLKAHPESLTYLAGKFVRRHRAGVAAGLLLTLVLIAATTISVSFGLQAQRKSASADQKATGMSDIIDALTESGVAGEGSLRDRLLKVAETTLPRLEDYPDAEADVRLKIGRTLYQLGDLENSEAMLLRARELYEGLYGRADVRTDETVLRLGYLRYRQGRYEEALALFEECSAILGGMRGVPPESLAGPLHGRAIVHRKRNHLAEAERLLAEAADIYRQAGAGLPLVEVLKEQAAILNERGDHDAAAALLMQGLTLWREARGDHDARIGELYNRLAEVHLAAGHVDEAITSGRAALDAQRTLDPLSPRLARSMVAHAQSLMRRAGAGDHQAAMDLVQEARRIYTIRYGESHEFVAGALLTLGQLHSDMGEHVAAIVTIERALAIYTSEPETPDWIVGAARTVYGKVLAGAGRPEEAEAQLLEAWSLLEPTEMTPRKAQIATALADLYASLGREDDAAAWRGRPLATP